LIFDNQYIQERISKAERLREEGINPYPANITKGMPSSEFFEHFAQIHPYYGKSRFCQNRRQ